VHHYGAVPFDWRALWRSTLLQASWSVVWSVFALLAMLHASRRALRGPWLGGAAVLGLVVLKLFVVDLARGGTVARIVSFIVVGLLLVAVGYLSPLPPRPRPSEER